MRCPEARSRYARPTRGPGGGRLGPSQDARAPAACDVRRPRAHVSRHEHDILWPTSTTFFGAHEHDQHIRWRAHGVQHNRAHWHATNVNGLSTMKNIQKIYKCHGSCSMLDARLFGHPLGRSLRSKGDALTGQWPRRRSTSLSKSSPRGSIPMFPMFCSATHICSGVGQPLSSYMLRSTGSPSTGS